jgi:hypothetical protein
VQAGYRHIDCARLYCNEKEVLTHSFLTTSSDLRIKRSVSFLVDRKKDQLLISRIDCWFSAGWLCIEEII